MSGLVLAVLVPSVMSVAVTVQLPSVLLVRLKTPDPRFKAVLAGNTALGSVEVIPTVWITLVIGFQFASTALTVTL